MNKNVLVCGAGGFIGAHLVRFLKNKGYFVAGVDLKYPEFWETKADEFYLFDLREFKNCDKIFNHRHFDEVYQLAADMGGMGFISIAECEILRNNNLINSNMLEASRKNEVERYFFSSSVCVYRDVELNEELTEEDAYPACPDNEYGWEKLYAERMALAYARNFGMTVRVARFQNTMGPYGTWCGGREKAPAAICRKIAETANDGTIDVWGDGTAIRSYTYIDDLLEGIYLLTQSDQTGPMNIGSSEFISVKELVEIVAEIARKKININYVSGPVGVQFRNFSKSKIYSLGWKQNFLAKDGLKIIYPWVKNQVEEICGK